MILRLLLLVLLAACGARSDSPDAPELMRAAVAAERLYVIQLPAGDVEGFSIDVPNWTGHKPERKFSSSTWLSQGYTGVVFNGQGKALTHVRPGGAESTIIFDRHAGTVRLSNLTVHCGSRHGVFAGLEHHASPVEPKFRLEMADADVLADGVRTTWGIFYYQCDLDLRDVKIDVRNGLEHSMYGHGFAKLGANLVRVRSKSAAEGFKVRSSRSETAWVPNTTVNLQSCAFDFWYEPWSNRGGAGVVLQGASCNLIVQGCLFRNLGGRPDPDGDGPLQAIPSNQRTRAIMVDDGSGDFWGLDGRPGQGFATGHVVIKGNGFDVGPGGENLSILVRVGNLAAGPHRIAKSLTITGNAMYGERLQLQMTNLPTGKLEVSGCNTPDIKGFAEMMGIDTTFECLIPLPARVIPVSEGLRR